MLIIFSLLFGLALAATDDNVLKIEQGQLRGSILKSRGGRDFKAFQGIPYAKPPIGGLRFKAPVPAEKWKDDILDATSEPQPCIQKNLFMYKTLNDIVGDEDCLYLNVYTSKVPKRKTKKDLMPVMVWIPGGGFSSGTGGLSSYGPHYLLDKDVVVVSLNYRLGPLGFLSTEDDALPGNYGMKDQVLALKWVKTNIMSFGGDPDRVTIFGQSAGSASVGLHLLSPMSKGLFHKAILESGTPLLRWAVSPPGFAKRRALAFSTIAGCSDRPTKMAECLRDFPANVLVDLHYNFFEWEVYPSITFMPVVENCQQERSFLCNYPLSQFEQISKVPVMMGMNSGEGGIFASRMYNATGLAYPQLKEDFRHYISSLLIYKYTAKTTDLPSIGGRIFDRYFPDGQFENHQLDAVNMVTGGLILPGVVDMATNLSSPVYYYVYDHLNEISYNQFYGPYPKPLGVTHGDEMISLFFIQGQKPLQSEDLRVSNLMIDLWTRFAMNEKVTVDGRTNGTAWPVFDGEDMEYLLINSSTPVISEKPLYDEYLFWNDLPVMSALVRSGDRLPRTEL